MNEKNRALTKFVSWADDNALRIIKALRKPRFTFIGGYLVVLLLFIAIVVACSCGLFIWIVGAATVFCVVSYSALIWVRVRKLE